MRTLLYLLISICLFGCKAFKPSADLSEYNPFFIKSDTTSTLNKGEIRVTFFGTSSLLFDDGKTQLLIDGFFSRPGVMKVAFGKVKSNIPLIKSILQKHHITNLKGIFVCHSHYDHAMDAPAIAKLTNCKLYGSASTLNLGKGEMLPDSLMVNYVTYKPIQFGDFTVTILDSKHTPPFELFGKTNATDPNHSNIEKPLRQPAKVDHYIEGGTYDIYITYGDKKMLVKASTNYLPGALDKYPTDVLFLGTAMLGIQNSEFQNEYYQQTVVATHAKTVIPIHWDNFMKPFNKPLVALPNISDNVAAGFNFLIQKSKENRINFQLLQIEKSIVF